MYKKDLKKLEYKQLKKLVSGLTRCRNASQSIVDATEGVVKSGGGRKELKQHLRWYERQLNKAEEVLTMQLQSRKMTVAKKSSKSRRNSRKK